MTTKPSLEDRMKPFSQDFIKRLNAVVDSSDKKARSEYLQKNNVSLVEYYLKRYSMDKKSPAVSTINKEPLKPVVYGIKLFGEKDITKLFVNQLTGAEALYLFSGMYAENSSHEETRILTPYAAICDYIEKGVEVMAKVHNSCKTKAPKSHHQVYETKPTLPYASEIGKEIKFPEIVKRLHGLFKAELKDVEVGEEIGKIIADMKDDELKVLSKYFTKETLRDFYRV